MVDCLPIYSVSARYEEGEEVEDIIVFQSFSKTYATSFALRMRSLEGVSYVKRTYVVFETFLESRRQPKIVMTTPGLEIPFQGPAVLGPPIYSVFKPEELAVMPVFQTLDEQTAKTFARCLQVVEKKEHVVLVKSQLNSEMCDGLVNEPKVVFYDDEAPRHRHVH